MFFAFCHFSKSQALNSGFSHKAWAVCSEQPTSANRLPYPGQFIIEQSWWLFDSPELGSLGYHAVFAEVESTPSIHNYLPSVSISVRPTQAGPLTTFPCSNAEVTSFKPNKAIILYHTRKDF